MSVPRAGTSRDRTLGWLAVAVGLGLALAVQLRAPVGVPLYDGVVVAEPYRYLHPSGDQPDDPTSASSTEDVSGSQSPVFAIATDEQPPQAQLIAQSDALQLPPGTTQLQISIKPIDPQAQPTAGAIAGNVYRFAVTTQGGAPVTVKSCEACLSLVLRTPPEVVDGTVAHFENGAWAAVNTFHAGTVAMFQANAASLGDYAVITGSGGGAGGGSGGADVLLFGAVGALALFVVAVAGLFWYRRRPPPVPIARLGTGRGRIPSKRKAPRRPPSGRSGS
jgi:hypothetical protein